MENAITIAGARESLCPIVSSTCGYAHCKATKCMMFRIVRRAINRQMACVNEKAMSDPPNRPPFVPDDWEFVPYCEIEDVGAHWLEPDKEAELRTWGYCGLAGKP